MSTKVISVARDFSPVPAGRHFTDGPFPGAKFRDELLLPALKAFDDVTIELDGTVGMGSSFLEEAFGGLVRLGYSESILRQRLHIQTSRESYAQRIWDYIGRARLRSVN